jgi:hypothetical protein
MLNLAYKVLWKIVLFAYIYLVGLFRLFLLYLRVFELGGNPFALLRKTENGDLRVKSHVFTSGTERKS